MISNFDDLSCFEYNDLVGILDGRKSVSNHNARNLTQLFLHIINGSLHLSLVFLVECGCRFIENEQFWFFNEGSCESDSLLLTARHLVAR